MAYRLIYGKFWTDPMIMEEMTSEDKLFYLYILTNPSTTSCGIYSITKKQMAFELDYSLETVNRLMERFEKHFGLIRYNPKTWELAIKNWGKYNLSRGGKPMIDCMISELSKIKDKSLIHYIRQNISSENLLEIYESFYDPSSISQRLVAPQGDNTNTNTYTNTDTSTERDKIIERDTNVDTIIYAERDTSAIKNTNTIKNKNTNTIKNTNTKTITDTEQERERNVDANIDINIDADIHTNMHPENGAKKDAELVKEQTTGRDDAHSLSLSLVKEYENLTGHIGAVNLGAVKLAVIKHGYSNVQKAMAKALEKGKLSMSYVNGILQTWAKEGYPKEGENYGNRSTKTDKCVNRDEFQGFKPQPPRALSEEERRSMEKELL